MTSENERLPMSCSFQDPERVSYLKRVLEEKAGSQSQTLRHAVDLAIENDTKFGEETGDSTSVSTPDDTDNGTRTEEESALVPLKTDGGTVEVDLADPKSPIFVSDKVALNPRQLPANWKHLETLPSTYEAGRDKVVKAISRYLFEEKSVVTKTTLYEAFRDAGLSKSTAHDYINKLVADDVLYPHPSMEQGVLSEALLEQARSDAAGRPVGSYFDGLDRERYPNDWGELLTGYDKLYRAQYYPRESDYLDALGEVIEIALVSMAEVNQNQGRKTKDSMTGMERIHAWNAVSEALLKELMMRLGGEVVEESGLREEYTRLSAVARSRMNPATRNNYSTPDGEPAVSKEEAKKGVAGWFRDLAQFREKLHRAIEEEKGGVSRENLTMDEREALESWEWTMDNVRNASLQDVKERYRELAMEYHNDQSATDTSARMKKINVARDVIEELVRDES